MKKHIWGRPITAAIVVAVLSGTVSASADDAVNGWSRSTDAYDEARMAALDRAIEAEEYRSINSVVVIKDGRLLLDRYYNGATRDSTHNPRSVSKTFASAVLGIAIAGGHIESVHQPLSDFYDLERYENYSPAKASVTLRDLLTMSSGFDGFDFAAGSPGNEENMYPQPNWVEWTLNLPMASDRDPGDEWRYFTAGVVILGDILNRRLPGGLENFAHEHLFGKLGISNYEWQHTPQRVANTAGGTQLTPLDFAKFGELYRNGGRWQGESVMPQDWVRESMRPLIETTVPGNRYGYLWWHKRYDVGDRDYPVAYCTGNGGNKIFVFDDLPLVVVVTASAYGQRYMHSQVDEIMTRYVIPSVASQ